MITQGPFTLTLGDTLPLNDPGATSNNPATAVQIQNASPFIIEVNAGGTLLTIQSFTAQTVVTSGGGQQMSVEPIGTNIASVTTSDDSLTVVWLLAGESSPMVDGPLTAAAIVAAISGALTNYNVGGGSIGGQTNLAAGATAVLAGAPAAGKCYRMQLFTIVGTEGVLEDGSTSLLVAYLATAGTIYLGGQIIHGSIEVTNQSGAGMEVSATWDEITIPVAP